MIIKDKLDLPDSLANVWSEDQMLARDFRLSMRVTIENPLNYRLEEQEKGIDLARARKLKFWKNNHPKVELLATENPDIDYRLLESKWTGKGAPMVRLRVTPKKLKLPSGGGIMDTLGMVAPVLSFIPVVGGVVSTAATIASQAQSASDAKEMVSAMTKIPESAFEPTYFPQPFPVYLPLDMAQTAVAQPWYIPGIVDEFNKKLENEVANQYAERYAELSPSSPIIYRDIDTSGIVDSGVQLEKGSSLEKRTGKGARTTIPVSDEQGGDVWRGLLEKFGNTGVTSSTMNLTGNVPKSLKPYADDGMTVEAKENLTIATVVVAAGILLYVLTKKR